MCRRFYFFNLGVTPLLIGGVQSPELCELCGPQKEQLMSRVPAWIRCTLHFFTTMGKQMGPEIQVLKDTGLRNSAPSPDGVLGTKFTSSTGKSKVSFKKTVLRTWLSSE